MSVNKTMRLDAQVVTYIEIEAIRQNRSFSNMVETILKDYLKQKKDEQLHN
jgi:hypothetical protein